VLEKVDEELKQGTRLFAGIVRQADNRGRALLLCYEELDKLGLLQDLEEDGVD